MTETSASDTQHLCLICGRHNFVVTEERRRCPTCNTERIRPMTEEELTASREKGWLRRLLGR